MGFGVYFRAKPSVVNAIPKPAHLSQSIKMRFANLAMDQKYE
jgi:hypothetical protein